MYFKHLTATPYEKGVHIVINYMILFILSVTCLSIINMRDQIIKFVDFFTPETWSRKRSNKIHHTLHLLKTDLELKYYTDFLNNKVYTIR